MKKHYNEKHDVVIESRFIANTTNPKEGEIIPHKQKVDRISFFQMTEDGKWYKVYMTKESILDIAYQINEIESQIIDKTFDPDFPW